MFKAIIKSAEEVDLICGIDPEVVEARLILYYGSQEALDEAVAKSMQEG